MKPLIVILGGYLAVWFALSCAAPVLGLLWGLLAILYVLINLLNPAFTLGFFVGLIR